MNWKKWLKATVATVVVTTSLYIAPVGNVMASERTIEDESIYDLLVDRFFNGSGNNDFDANAKDPSKFNGGDFIGLVSKKAFIENMGFTIVSIGNVFDTITYDGSQVTSFEQLEKRFGTEEEFLTVIKSYQKSNLKVMIDFPVDLLSEQHNWFANNDNQQWIDSKVDNKVKLNLQNVDLQQALIEQLRELVEKYDVSIRLVNIEDTPEALLNSLITTVKEVRPEAYVIANSESNANFDARYDNKMIELQRNIFKTVDQSTESIVAHKDSVPPTQVLVDSPWSDRFILYGEKEGMYPPTRAKMAVLSTLLIPGVPVVQYGTEIAMNGEKGQDAHQLYNFKTDSELVTQIKNIQTLRNSSDTLRKGKFEIVRNENGFLAFTRTSDKEKWLVVINNTSKTETAVLTEEMVGKNQKLSAMLELETIRADKNGHYNVVLDREMIEIYQIQDDKGINKSYLIALGLVYILFTWFVIVIVKKGKKSRTQK